MMRKFISLSVCLLLFYSLWAQGIAQRLNRAYQQFENDSQLRHAISSFYVIDAKTGKVIFDKNSQVGLAPASTQKIITAATAFELLGKDYRYKTELGYKGEIKEGVLQGDLYLVGNGDPTLGSWRWEQTREENVLSHFTTAVRKSNIRQIRGSYNYLVRHFETPSIPDGWIWQDVGNYYGAPAQALNWRENQYDLVLRSGPVRGSQVEVVRTRPTLSSYQFDCKVTAGPKGSGDNAYIYLPIGSNIIQVTGTIPVGEKEFVISGAIPRPESEFYRAFLDSLSSYRIEHDFSAKNYMDQPAPGDVEELAPVWIQYSPSLDSIVYWFLQKSINLYGEAMVKTFAYEKDGFGATDKGIDILQDFWAQKGIEKAELNISDGSGLSPQNRVTAHAQVEILKYAKSRDWYPYFYDALPTYNGMKMKSGTIRNVKGFCGYHKSGDGHEYIFSFLVNNFSGSSSGVVGKMYRVLDVLK